jgi:hypothetical protein
VGWLNPHLIELRNVTGRRGCFASTCTDMEYRSRGYARATITPLLDLMRSAGVGRVNLHATGDGEPLYRSLGFTATRFPNLILPLLPERPIPRSRPGTAHQGQLGPVGNHYSGGPGGFGGDAALRLYAARKMRPMATATAATTIPPMIEAAAEAPVAKAMTK